MLANCSVVGVAGNCGEALRMGPYHIAPGQCIGVTSWSGVQVLTIFGRLGLGLSNISLRRDLWPDLR